jgi:hypothetical protein
MTNEEGKDEAPEPEVDGFMFRSVLNAWNEAVLNARPVPAAAYSPASEEGTRVTRHERRLGIR